MLRKLKVGDAGQTGGTSGENGRAAGIVRNISRGAARLRHDSGMGNSFGRREMKLMTGVHAAEHLAVNQIESALLGNNAFARRLMLINRIAARFIQLRLCLQRRDGFMGMPGSMTQCMGQRALLRRQQQQRQHPSQGDGAQHSGEQRPTRHG